MKMSLFVYVVFLRSYKFKSADPCCLVYEFVGNKQSESSRVQDFSREIKEYSPLSLVFLNEKQDNPKVNSRFAVLIIYSKYDIDKQLALTR